ncbi:hypothetical protein HZZ00_20130 [Streptomyces sp. NEAU-sy36]|uniref:Chromate resistance protein ChrB n=1 Tax=unclassified Streptomyces TaxID=2593676 RepID=UPI0015D5D1AE|nr:MULTISPECIES: Chromate resistance protein ChrB [unclassified Streptomyces]QLJ03063.1 hypothetical protein HZZ00_20130 [Streptomyces sp. NEAU-sy36]
MQWVVLIVRLPAQPSRRRVAVWRELRKAGALPLCQGVWAVPDVPVFAGGVRRALEPAERAGGESAVLRAAGRAPQGATRFEAMFTARPAECARRFEDHGERVFAPLHAFCDGGAR